jgi:uncharacterized membrane protein
MKDMATEQANAPLELDAEEKNSRLLSALAYVQLIFPINLLIALFIIFTKKTDKFARFHALQSLFLIIAYLVALAPFMIMFLYFWASAFFSFWNITSPQGMENYFMNWVLAFIPGLIGGLMGLVMLVLTSYLAVTAYSGKIVKVPFVWSLAERFL